MKKAFLGPKQRPAFRDNYLAAFVVMALLLCSVTANAQTRDQLQQINASGYLYKTIGVRTILYLPEDSVSTTDSGAIAYNNRTVLIKRDDKWITWGKMVKINDTTYTISGDTIIIPGGGGGGGSTDKLDSVRLRVGGGSDPDTLREFKNGDSTLVGYVPKAGTAGGGIGQVVAGDGLQNVNDSTLQVDSSRYETRYRTDTAKVNLRSDIAGKQPAGNYITGLNTDVAATGPGTVAATIQPNVVGNTKLAQAPALSVKANPTNSTANSQDVTGTANQVMRVASDGASLGFGAVNIASSSAVTGLLPENNLQAFKPYPEEYEWKTLYERSSWPDLGDFSTSGTASISLSGGYVNVTASTQDYTPRVYFKPEWATGLNYWKTTVWLKIIQFGTPSNWTGPFIKSLVNHDGANFGYQFFTSVTSAGTGNSFFTTENGSIISNPGAGSGVTKSVNDVLEMTMERADTTLTFTLRNLTTTTTATPITYPFPASNTPNILPNVGQWGLLLNAAGGIFQIQYIKIESTEKVAPNVLIIGNSKTANGATTFNRRFPTQLNATYPTVTWSAGTAERMDPDMFYKRPELTFRNPEYVIFASVHDNDKRAGVSDADIIEDMIRLENYWKGGGTKVLWMCFPEDSTAGGANGLTNIRNWLVANRSDNYINTWDSLRTGPSDNRLKDIYDNGDGVHGNAAFHDKVNETIIASGKISTISTNRRAMLRTKDPNLRVIGDSVGLTFDWSRVANNIPRVNSSYNVTGSTLWDNGTNVIASTSVQPTAPHANSRLSSDGLFSIYGSAGAGRFYSRSVATDFFELYHNSSTLYMGYNGTDGAAFGTKGQLRIGRMTGITNTVMTPYFQLYGTNSFASSSNGYNGLITRLDSVGMLYTGAGTGLGDVTAHSFGHEYVMANTSSNADTLASLTGRGAPRDSTNFTSTTKLAFYVREGAAVFGGNVSILKRALTLQTTAGPRQMLVYDTTTGKVDRMDIPIGTVSTTNSVTGDGSSGTPIKLVNDVSSTTKNHYYGSNEGNTRGWNRSPVYLVEDVGSTTGTGTVTYTINPPNGGRSGFIQVTATGYDATNSDSWTMTRNIAYKRSGSVLTLYTSHTIGTDDGDGALNTATLTFVNSSDTCVITVTGVTGLTIRWSLLITWLDNPSSS